MIEAEQKTLFFLAENAVIADQHNSRHDRFRLCHEVGISKIKLAGFLSVSDTGTKGHT